MSEMVRKRVLFMATGDIAIPAFRALLETEYEVLGLVTQPDRKVGRKQIITPPRIKVVAEEAGLSVWQPEKLRGSEQWEELSHMAIDVIVVMAYGQILSKAVIEKPQVACINLHASLLPRHRGAACIQAAIDAGDDATGVSVMHVVPKLDAGDVILQKTLPLDVDSIAGAVHDALAEISPAALLEALDQLFDGTAKRMPQDVARVTYAPKLLREDGELDWTHDAAVLERRIRAFEPWPGTSTTYRDAKGRARRLKVFAPTAVEVVEGKHQPGTVLAVQVDGILIACGQGALRVQNLQPEGKGKMTAAQFAAGNEIRAFGS